MITNLHFLKPTAPVLAVAISVWIDLGGIVMGDRDCEIISQELPPFLLQSSGSKPASAMGLCALSHHSHDDLSSWITTWGRRHPGKRSEMTRLPLLPYPMSVVTHAGEPFVLRRTSVITRTGLVPESEEAIQALVKLIDSAPTGVADEASEDSKDCGEGNGSIELRLTTDASLASANPEAYNLTIGSCKVELTAPSLAGLFYGVQTIRQLSHRGLKPMPAVTIIDAPRLKWRGLHLDVSRHFFSADKIRELIDIIASFKFNRFHWHLTDDQGWRMPVSGFPKLVEIGSQNDKGEKEYYSAEQIADIVKYASARHIEILPEVDIPGHVASAIASYPYLGNDDSYEWEAPFGPERSYGIKQFTLSPADATMSFLDQVFDQVAKYFPGSYVHIGGDEAPTEQWDRSTLARMKLKGENFTQVQSLFSVRVSQILLTLNKTAVVWDEAQGMIGLREDAVIMAWRSEDELKRAVKNGRRAINAIQDSYYFDHGQGGKHEPHAISCCLDLQTVYEYDPVPPVLKEEEKARIMGAQGQLWSEYITSWSLLEYFAFPRSLALAERLWTPNVQIENHGYFEFLHRLRVRLEDLDARQVNYRKLDS